MALLDRYLQEVSRWLPRAQAADIVAELRADIQAEIDERSASTDRPVTEAEEEAILTRWGHPMLVASRYQTQQPLIGPTLLPAYYVVLKLVGAIYLLPWFLFWVGREVVLRAGAIDAGRALASLQPLAVQALVLFALITAGFAAVDRRHRREHTLERWTARALTAPAARDWREKSRFTALVDLVVDLAVLSWWVGLAGEPASRLFDPAVRVVVPPAQAFVYWAVLVLLVAGAAMAAADLWRPRWSASRLGLQIAMDGAALAAGLVLISFSLLQVVPGADTDLATSEALVRWINLSWKATLGVIVLLLAGRIVANARRLGRVNAAGPRP